MKKSIRPALISLTTLALPVMMASSVWLATSVQAVQSTDGNRPHRIDLAELEARTVQRFNELDSNNDGLVDAKEFANAPEHAMGPRDRRQERNIERHKEHHKERRLGRQPDATELAERNTALFTQLDTDNNGELSTSEFEQLRNARNQLRHQHRRERHFEHIDANSDAQLTLAEFQQRLEKMRALDTNADGSLSRAELQQGKKERRRERADRYRDQG